MTKTPPLTFAKAYQELQDITANIEKEDLDLESLIPQFKRAAELVKFLKSKLTDIQNQIQEINLGLDDQPASS